MPDTLYPVRITVDAAYTRRDRLTTAFRLILAIPHLILVGGPGAAIFGGMWGAGDSPHYYWGTGGGVLGAVAAVVSIIAWFAILFTGRYPEGLWNLAAFYLRWRVRAVAYTALLRDEYPPFGDGPYPATVHIDAPALPRDRLSVAFRIILAIPQIFMVWVLGMAWGLASIVAWFAILFTGRYPESLYDFAVGAMCWSIRVEAYLLLLNDEYPPFSLQ